MYKFAQKILKYRILIIVVTIILTAFFTIGLTHIQINSDILTYLKPNDPVIKLFKRVGDEYSGNFLVMVGIETDDVFTIPSLKLVRDLTEACKGINGVMSVMSLTDVLDIRKTEGMLEVGRLVDKDNLPQTPEELKRLKEYALSKELYRGSLVSEDSRITLLVCRITHEVNRAEVAREIKAITEEKGNGFKFYYTGIPVEISDMQDTILKDVIKLIPIVTLVIIFILFFSFRSIRGVLLPLIAVLISTTWTLGLMGWIGVPLSLISNIIPVVLIAIGSAYGIHFVARYDEVAIAGGSKIEVTTRALSEVGIPIILAGVTTLIGFLSFFGSYLTAITEFGIYTAIGVGFALIITITFIPAIVSFLKVKVPNKIKAAKEPKSSVVMKHISRFVLNRRWYIFITVILIAMASIIGLPKIRRAIDLMEYFPKNSNIRRAEGMMRTEFGGSTPIQVIVKGNVKDPFVLKKIHRLEKFINSLPYVSNGQSIASLISEMNDVMNGRYCIPNTRDEVANLWFFIESEDILQQLVNKDNTEALIQARLATENTHEVINIVRTIDKYLTEINKNSSAIDINILKGTELKKIKDWQYGEIAASIYYDAIGRLTKLKLNKDTIKSKVEKALESGSVKLSAKSIDSFKSELEQYFKKESQLILPSDDAIAIAVNSVIGILNSHKFEESGFSDILRKIAPLVSPSNEEGTNAGNSEDIASTSKVLAEKAKEAYGKAKVDFIMAQIIPIFPKELIKNQDFINDVRGDLWVINEQKWVVPDELKKDDETVNFTAIQAGMPMVYDRIDHSLLRNQLQSLILAIAMVIIILSVQFHSIKIGLISVSPIIFTVLVNFGIMAYFGVALDIATLMVGGIAIGIGIDYTIHFTNRFRHELRRTSNEEDAIVQTINTTGKAIIINAISVALGFSVLLLAQLNPVRQFGWMVAVTMIVSSLSAITYLPAVILISRLRYRSLK